MTEPNPFEDCTRRGRKLNLPPGEELPFIAGQMSDQALYLEHLREVVQEQYVRLSNVMEVSQQLVDHVATLTDRLVMLQSEIRAGMNDLRGSLKDTAAELRALEHTVGAIRQKTGALPLPPE